MLILYLTTRLHACVGKTLYLLFSLRFYSAPLTLLAIVLQSTLVRGSYKSNYHYTMQIL